MELRKIILCAVLAAGSAFGMEQAIVKMKADVLLAENHRDANNPDDILLTLYKKSKDLLTEPLVREFVKRGANLNLCDREKGDTIFCLALQDKNIPFFLMLTKFGTSLDLAFRKVLQRFRGDNRNWIGNTFVGRTYARDEELLCANLWSDQQRKQLLKTYLLLMNRLNVFPKDIVKLILSLHCPEVIPNHCLKTFYSQERVESIKQQRTQEMKNLFAGFAGQGAK